MDEALIINGLGKAGPQDLRITNIPGLQAYRIGEFRPEDILYFVSKGNAHA